MTTHGITVPIFLPTLWRSDAAVASNVTASGLSTGDALNDLVTRYAGLRARPYDERGAVWHFVTIFRNDEDVRFLEADRTPLQEGETLAVVPAIAGG